MEDQQRINDSNQQYWRDYARENPIDYNLPDESAASQLAIGATFCKIVDQNNDLEMEEPPCIKYPNGCRCHLLDQEFKIYEHDYYEDCI